jgi:hypothetical protein
LPVLADFYLVPKQVWAPSEVLEIMRVNALCLVVVMVERTPLGLEVEHEEIEVVCFDARHQVMD